jgi:transposase InsO family protein
MRGRRPAGPEYVERLQGSTEAKQRLKTVLEVTAGRLRVQEACQRLGICEQRFHQLRDEAFVAALAGLEPGVPGRPPRTPSPEQEQVRVLEAQLAAKDVELRAAQAREEIVLTLSRVAPETEPAPQKKNDTTAASTGPAAWEETAHMNRLQELLQHSADAPPVSNRRGPGRQRLRREREHRLRTHVVDFCRWTQTQGWRPGAIAELLHLPPRTLRQWCCDLDDERLRVSTLGRPVLRAAPSQRNEVITVLDELGPRLGVPTLRPMFPNMARAELADLVARYRRVWRLRNKQALHVLHWQVPGTVWAMDFAAAPRPIDGIYPYLLAVRDLASGLQLLWQPLRQATAAETLLALAMLFAHHGAPLVLKTDNGSPFCAEALRQFLADWQVWSLYSPPHTPEYNGAIEAGIGSLKSRTDEHASRVGRGACWSWDDVAAARLEANATARPQGPSGPTPDERWQARPAPASDQRPRFGASVDEARREVRRTGGWPTEGPLSEQDARAVDRQAIRRALEEHGLLLYSRRRIPLPFPPRKTAEIR